VGSKENDPKRTQQRDGSFCRTVEVVKMKKKNFLSGTWNEFEDWIKTKVGGEISWKVRPWDTKGNRMIVAESVFDAINRNGGEFPPSGNSFLELERDKDSS
jgi:hypothetical protein